MILAGILGVVSSLAQEGSDAKIQIATKQIR